MLDLAYAGDIVLFSNVYRGMQVLLEKVNNRLDAVCMRINASTIKVLSTLISGELCQAILLNIELTCLSSAWLGHRGDKKQDYSRPLRILSPAILSLVAARNIVAYKGQDLSGSGPFDSALQMRGVASTSR